MKDEVNPDMSGQMDVFQQPLHGITPRLYFAIPFKTSGALCQLARPPRFERGTLCLEGRCSIQLSYGRLRRFGRCADDCIAERIGQVFLQGTLVCPSNTASPFFSGHRLIKPHEDPTIQGWGYEVATESPMDNRIGCQPSLMKVQNIIRI